MSSLRSWWEDLHFLAPDSRADMGNLIRQIERGLLAAPAQSLPGEPAGWGGLSRRGSWSRLVSAEWALAEAAPEEFLRRACEGELNFWELAQQHQPQQRQLWIWVDLGPDQLGACRLVQMSVLLLFDHLCRQSGGYLCWGSIQQPAKGYEGFGPEEIRAFLRARSLDPGRKPPEIDPKAQVWCLGSPTWLTQVPASVQKISLVQSDLEWVELCHLQHKIPLRLPPPHRALRLLRDPLRSQSVTSSSGIELNHPQALVFSPCGRKLLSVESSRVVMMPLPSSPGEVAGKIRRFPLRRAGQILAVAWERRSLYVAQAHEGAWFAYRQNPGDTAQDGFVSAPAPVDPGHTVGSVWPSPRGCWSLWVDDQLWRLESGHCQARFSTRGGEGAGRHALLACQGRDALVDEEERLILELSQEKYRYLWLCNGWGSGFASGAYGLALALEGDQYRLLWRNSSALIHSGGHVLGVTYFPTRQQPALVVQQFQEFHILGPDWSQVLHAGARILQAALHRDGLLAYRTNAGQVRCHSFLRDCTLWEGYE